MTVSKLSAILDSEAEAEQPMMTSQSPDDSSAEVSLHQEHVKRMAAEADAEASARRLAVAQTQFSEYLAEKASIGEGLVEKTAEIEASLRQLAGIATTANVDAPHSNPKELAASMCAELTRLRDTLSATASDAKFMAQQVAAESERMAKRSSSQADLRSATQQDKRAREDGAAAEAEEASMDEDDGQEDDGEEQALQKGAAGSCEVFSERAKYIPLRLTQEERRVLRLLEGALNVSEYTDKVDILSWRHKTQRVTAQIKDLCAVLCGLTVAQNFKRGQTLIANRDFDALAPYFQNVFEIGRRFKIMNVEKMRDTYGKLLYMLMDSVDDDVAEMLGFRCVRPLQTVYSFLEEAGALGMLEDPLLPIATAEIDSRGRSRVDIQRDIRRKEKARETLAKKYRSTRITHEDLEWTMYSISDHHSYLAFARDPVDRMIDYLKTYFSPNTIEQGFSLAIRGGVNGARLTHSHERQYTFVLQSLTLWREIAHDMFRLWTLAEGDMLSDDNGYRLQNTGQGLQRVQAAPRVARAMAGILNRCQRRLGSWVGSSVVHLGDHAVPNALMFIDKYTQVPRILNPLVLVLDELPRLVKGDAKVAAYLDTAFGGVEACRKLILADFFKFGFDGSGSDSGFFAGDCIDGRLTSAWEWASKIHKKPFWPVFKLAGFIGFDGDFKN